MSRPLAIGPGNLGRRGAAGVMIWAAGSGIHHLDLFAGFWEYDARQLDWLAGFLCDPDTTAWFEALANPRDEDEEPEELFARGSMNTLGSDVVDDV